MSEDIIDAKIQVSLLFYALEKSDQIEKLFKHTISGANPIKLFTPQGGVKFNEKEDFNYINMLGCSVLTL